MTRRVATVFGGSGFVGRHIVKRLAAQGWIVRVGVRDPEGAAFLKPMGEAGQIVPVRADITDADTVAPLVANATAVINLVGILFERGRRTFQRVHVDGAETVARAARAAGVECFVHMSAIGASLDSTAHYARTKAEGERAVAAAFEGASIHRPSVIFGPEDNFFNQFAGMARFAPALPVFPTRFQPVYVGDVADAFLKTINDASTRGKTYELGGPRVMSFREILQLVLQETRRKRLLIPVPLTLGSLQATLLEILPKPPLTRDQVRLMETDNVVAAGALTLHDLGIEATPVEAIVPGYLSRYRNSAEQSQAASRPR
jgi:uncharacterized protein YbjT (DUF2867 family)